MTKLQKSALVCGALPLLAGTGVYIAWRITRNDLLMVSGLWVIVLGLLAFLTGLACLAANHLRRADKTQGDQRTSGRILVLLLLNFPAAAACVWSAGEASSRYTLTVINDGPLPVSDFTVNGAGVSLNLGSIAPGDSKDDYFHPTSEGALNFTARRDGKAFGGCFDGYATGGLAGQTTIRIHPDGRWSKSEQADQRR